MRAWPPASSSVPPGQPLISVVVCTRNRAGSLRRLFESLARLELPTDLVWELVLIDNGSTDDTPAVAESFMGRLPIRRIEHREAGVANARNRALEEARGVYICWTDDDTIVGSRWLASYADAFARYPEAAIFGGPIVPAIAGSAPRWLLREQHRWPLDAVVGYIDPGAAVAIGRKPWGANWAVRRAECRSERFDAALGWAPAQARVAEETDLIDRLLRGGATGWWVPDAKLRHCIAADRLGWRTIYRHYVACGGTDAYIMARSPAGNWVMDRPTRLLRMGPRDVRARMVWHGLQHALWRLVLQKPRALRALARCGYYRGIAKRWEAAAVPNVR